jgi:Ca2+-binding EF-hand superfamily protein
VFLSNDFIKEMKLKLPIVSFDDDDVDLMLEKMDINKDGMINVAELLDLINILNISNFENEIKFMFAPFANEQGTGTSTFWFIIMDYEKH